MKNTLEYKGYIGSIEFSAEDTVFFGKVLGIRSLISYEGETAKSLLCDFKNAIDDYLEMCGAEGIEPEKPYKGSFNVRISPNLHRQAALIAASTQMTLNSFVEKSIELAVISFGGNNQLSSNG